MIIVIGIPSAYNLDVLGLLDKIAGEFFLVVGAFFLALFVGYKMRDPIEELRHGFASEGLLRGWLWTVRVLVPLILALVIYRVGAGVVGLVRSMM